MSTRLLNFIKKFKKAMILSACVFVMLIATGLSFCLTIPQPTITPEDTHEAATSSTLPTGKSLNWSIKSKVGGSDAGAGDGNYTDANTDKTGYYWSGWGVKKIIFGKTSSYSSVANGLTSTNLGNNIYLYANKDDDTYSKRTVWILSDNDIYANSDSSYMFFKFWHLTSIVFDNFNTSNVTNMSYMFANFEPTTLNLTKFDTSKVTNMSHMFSDNSNLKTIYVSSSWSTSKVTSSTGMFSESTKLVGGSGYTYNSSYTDKSRAQVNTSSQYGYLTGMLTVDPATQKTYRFDWNEYNLQPSNWSSISSYCSYVNWTLDENKIKWPGTKSIELTLISGWRWRDGRQSKTFTVNVEKVTLPVPTDNDSLSYSYTSLSVRPGNWSSWNYNSSYSNGGYYLSNYCDCSHSGDDWYKIGTHTGTVSFYRKESLPSGISLDDLYEWRDGTTGDKTFSYTVNKRSVTSMPTIKAIPPQQYRGYSLSPKTTVFVGGIGFSSNVSENFTAVYTNATNVGTATLTLTFNENNFTCSDTYKTISTTFIIDNFWSSYGYSSNPYTSSSQGTSEENPYLITSVTDLVDLANAVNNGQRYSGKYFKLTTDINLDFSDIYATTTTSQTLPRQWVPIGFDSSNYFAGYFDGGGHTIKGLRITIGGYAYNGLFGYSYAKGIKNLNLIDTNIYVSSSRFTTVYAGGLVGYIASSTISNCYNTGAVSATSSSYSYAYSGGLVGYASSSLTIENCFSSGNVTATGTTKYRGCIAGYLSVTSGSTITNVFSKGCNANIVGYNYNSNCTISNWYNAETKKYSGSFSSDDWFYWDKLNDGLPTFRSMFWVSAGVENQNIVSYLQSKGFTAA